MRCNVRMSKAERVKRAAIDRSGEVAENCNGGSEVAEEGTAKHIYLRRGWRKRPLCFSWLGCSSP